MKKIIIIAASLAAVSISSSAMAWGHHEYFNGVSAIEHASKAYRDYKDRGHSSSGYASGAGNPGPSTVTISNAKIVSAFSPDGRCEELIVDEINRAKTQILVQAYGFTDKGIIKALIAAHRRGVDVRIVLDKSNESQKYSGATTVSNAGIPTYIDNTVAIAHNKVMIFDEKTVETGSFNFTSSAEHRNAENIQIEYDMPELAQHYIADWKWRQGLSHPYARQ